jgi:PAS domain S-box-containing protein
MGDTIKARPGAGTLVRLTPFVVAVLLIIVNVALAMFHLGDLHRVSERIDRSLQRTHALEQIAQLSEASGQAQRSYRESGDPRQLDTYRQARAQLPAQLAQLGQLIDGDQTARLQDLAALIERDGEVLAADVTPTETHFGDAHLPGELSIAAERTETISAAIHAMLAGERRLVSEQLTTAETRYTVALSVGMLLRTTAIVLVVVALVVLYRRWRKNEALAQQHFSALHESEQRFHRVFDESPLGILLARADEQRVTQANPAFCRMLDCDAEHVVGRTVANLMHVDDRAMLNDAMRGSDGPNLDIEARYVTPSGTITWARVRLTQLGAPDGKPGLLLALTEDITLQKRVEAELRQAQKMEAIGQLTGGIAHDFNNLLGVIIGNVEFLIDSVTDPEQASLSREILDSALSGADLTRRLLAFARRQPLQPRRIDLNAYIPSHITILRRLLGETIAVTTDLAADLWPIRADPSQVGDGLLNLTINARDAMPHGGTIRISTANITLAAGELEELKPGDYVVLAVADSGIGMAPEVLERAVEPFFSTKGPRAGSGLGLSMIFGFAKQSGGHLRLESHLGHGTTVRLYLPRAVGADQYEKDEAADLPLLQGNESILLVDDNPDMRVVARRHLVSLGYRVSEAGNGPAALECMAGKAFDLLLTDVVMPDGMTGYQLAAAARQLRPELKVLFTTGYVRPDPAEEAAGLGGVTIRKPYRRHELATSVRAVLEDRPPAHAAPVRGPPATSTNSFRSTAAPNAPLSCATTTNESAPPMTLSR